MKFTDRIAPTPSWNAGSKEQRSVLRERRTEVLAALIRERVTRPPRRVLVVGCGSGLEAAVLATELQARVTGIDLVAAFDPEAAAIADLRQGDATCLDYDDRSFDVVYSYHALEHIPDCAQALLEMHRVLVDGGIYCIGTPNRLRVIGYLGGKEATFAQKVAWNVADIKAKVLGRFRNEYGAHAGFSSPELRGMLERIFGDATEITLQYYLGVYRNRGAMVNALARSPVAQFLFPAIYYMGQR